MKKLLSIMLVAIMAVALVPATIAVEPQDFDPIGSSFAGFEAYELAEGGTEGDLVTSDIFADYTISFVNIWSSGCSPCLVEMPHFQLLHENFSNHGVLVMGVVSTWINGTFPGAWNVLQTNGYTYLNVIQDNVIYGVYSQNNFVPQTFIVDSAGTIVDFIPGSATYNTLLDKTQYWLSVFSDEEYSVTFVDGVTNEVIEVQTVQSGHGAVAPTPPTHEGYTFYQWDTDFDFIIEDTVVTAIYTRQTYRVDFYDSISGERLKREYVRYGDSATAPTPPEYDGYTFEGWDQDFSFVRSNMEIYTIYTPSGDIVAGDVNGDGVVTTADALMALRGALTITTLTPEQIAAADIDGNGSITTADALAILRIALSIG